MYSIQEFLTPGAKYQIYGTDNRMIVTWSIDPKGIQIIKEINPWSTFVSGCFAIFAIFAVFEFMFPLEDAQKDRKFIMQRPLSFKSLSFGSCSKAEFAAEGVEVEIETPSCRRNPSASL
jgi:hypothetical protein